MYVVEVSPTMTQHLSHALICFSLVLMMHACPCLLVIMSSQGELSPPTLVLIGLRRLALYSFTPTSLHHSSLNHVPIVYLTFSGAFLASSCLFQQRISHTGVCTHCAVDYASDNDHDPSGLPFPAPWTSSRMSRRSSRA